MRVSREDHVEQRLRPRPMCRVEELDHRSRVEAGQHQVSAEIDDIGTSGWAGTRSAHASRRLLEKRSWSRTAYTAAENGFVYGIG